MGNCGSVLINRYQSDATPCSKSMKHIVLVGGGHSHVVALRQLALRPILDARITLICTDTDTPYSGMLPGYVAGHYRFDEAHINLDRLARFCRVQYCHDEVIGIDRKARKVHCRNAASVSFDLLSINIGSTPQLDQVPGASEFALPVKPIRQFNQRWLALLDRIRSHPGAMTIAVVGAGAGGVELLLAMQHRLRNERQSLGRDPDQLHFHLYSAAATILPTHNPQVRHAFAQILGQRGVQVHLATSVSRLNANGLQTDTGETLDADEIIWVTQAGGAPWLRQTRLALDPQGFIRIRDSLQSESDDGIFATGDCASMVDHPLPKAGVFAVRMGIPLAENLRRAIHGESLLNYRPQTRWLALIGTGKRDAVASRGAFYARGSLVWRWKEWIDRRFMRRFTSLPGHVPSTVTKPDSLPGAKNVR